eukprot:11212015-Lingulodinium_polyedra.AAC.1
MSHMSTAAASRAKQRDRFPEPEKNSRNTRQLTGAARASARKRRRTLCTCCKRWRGPARPAGRN